MEQQKENDLFDINRISNISLIQKMNLNYL